MIFNITGCQCIFALIPLHDAIVSVEIAPEGPAFADESGADGSVIRYATNERRATANVTLKGHSKVHAKMSALHGGDVSAINGLGVAPFLFLDGNGSTKVSTDKAWILGMPAKTFAQAPGDVTWAIRLVLSSPLNWVIGGNG